MKQYDYAVVGGGISGLVTAALLVLNKKSVCLLESSTSIGGYFKNISRDRVPYGAHHIAIPNIAKLKNLFSQMNINITDYLIAADEIKIVYDRKEYKLSLYLNKMRDHLKAYFDEHQAIDLFIDDLQTISEALNSEDENTIKKIFMDTVFISFEKYLDQYFKDATIKAVLSAIGPSYADVYIEDSAFTYISLLATYGNGTYYFKSYGDEIVEKLIAFIHTGDSTVKCGYRVNKVLHDHSNNKYMLVSNQEQEVEAASIVLACYPVDVLKSMEAQNARQQKLLSKCESMRIGSSAIRFYYKANINSSPQEIIVHQHINRLDKNNAEIASYIISVLDKEPNQINIMATVVRDEIDDKLIEDKLEPNLTQSIIKQLNLQEEDLHFEMAINAKNRERVTLNPKGSVFGWSRDVKGNLHSNIFKEIQHTFENIFVVGHWSSTFGVYGSLLTVSNFIKELDTEKTKV